MKKDKKVKEGILRLYLEVRYDFPFSLKKPLDNMSLVDKIINEHDGLYSIVESVKGEYAERMHAIMIDGQTDGQSFEIAFYEETEVDKIMGFGGK